MLRTTQRKTIDYDAIYTGLLEIVNLYSVEDIERCMCSPAQALKEFRTIGVTAPRQCGKTQWLIKMLNDDPDTSAIFYNEMSLKLAQNYLVDVDRSRLFTGYEVAEAKRKMTSGNKGYPVIQTRKVFVDDAYATIDLIGRVKLYKWLAKASHAEELIIVTVG